MAYSLVPLGVLVAITLRSLVKARSACSALLLFHGTLSWSRKERWSRIFAQCVKWNFCLTAGKDSARESGETHEEESTPEPLTDLQGESGTCCDQGRSDPCSAIGAI